MATNFLKRDQMYDLISYIPQLSCYRPAFWGRKPLDPVAFDLLTKITYEGALRMDEPLQLKVKHIDFEFEEIILPKTKTGWLVCRCAKTEINRVTRKKEVLSSDPNCTECKGRGKTRVDQYAWVPKWLFSEIHQFIKDRKMQKNQYLFESPSFRGQPISYKWCWENYKELGEIAGYSILARYKKRRTKGIYTHFFRKCKGKQMYFIDGFKLTEIAKKLRHKGDLRSLLAYLEAEEDDLREKERLVYG